MISLKKINLALIDFYLVDPLSDHPAPKILRIVHPELLQQNIIN